MHRQCRDQLGPRSRPGRGSASLSLPASGGGKPGFTGGSGSREERSGGGAEARDMPSLMNTCHSSARGGRGGGGSRRAGAALRARAKPARRERSNCMCARNACTVRVLIRSEGNASCCLFISLFRRRGRRQSAVRVSCCAGTKGARPLCACGHFERIRIRRCFVLHCPFKCMCL